MSFGARLSYQFTLLFLYRDHIGVALREGVADFVQGCNELTLFAITEEYAERIKDVTEYPRVA